MKLFVKFLMVCIAIIASVFNPMYGQLNLMYDITPNVVPEGIINTDTELYHTNKSNYASISGVANTNSPIYKYGKHEYYTKEGNNGEWELNNTSYYNYNDLGNLIKYWQRIVFDTNDNSYTLYFYDEQNRNIKIEYYWGDLDDVSMQSYSEIEYLDDFPEVKASVINYTKKTQWDDVRDEWKYVWEISSGEKNDYTLSKKIGNHYEKKVNYTYDPDNNQWNVSGYKYDYVVNAKGLIVETLVYQATKDSEDKWPLILHVKNLINDNSVVFRSERLVYQGSTPYIERWSNIEWDRHDGSMPISGYAVQGTNRMKNAKVEYLLISDPKIEYAPSCNFSSVYQNNSSFH